ncbi:hypothetical protein [Zavarzinia sp.]|uniref:hypothetical protein n=1 Tax=Zavarzinia sp. TaxID=2027920 RepID=UPI0035664071
MTEKAPAVTPGFVRDADDAVGVRRLLDLLDLIAEERMRLHGGDEQGAVMRLLLRQLLDGDTAGMPLLRLSRLAEVPRETLRRKLGVLLNRGYLMQDGDGRYHITPAYFTASAAARKRVETALAGFEQG